MTRVVAAILDRLSHAQNAGFEVIAVVVDQMERARSLRKDIADLSLESEVIEWRGELKEFEEELNRLEL